MQGILEMQRAAKAALAAFEQRGSSVEYARRDAVDEAAGILTQDPSQSLCLFGIKNTSQIDRDVSVRLQELPGFIFHTVDRMAPGGRAIDPNLINPLTGRMMTGSSSASCVNILLGINDLAVGTDGGGSLLAPALATGLYSIMAKGLGLKGRRQRVSTDAIPFVPGLGVISHTFALGARAAAYLADVEPGLPQVLKIVVVRPREERLASVLSQTAGILASRAELEYYDNPRCPDRPAQIEFLHSLFARFQLVLSFEGPIDLYGYGDSVMGVWGAAGRAIQDSGGKDLLKVANMVDATAVGIPAAELGSGVLILAPPGKTAGSAAIALGTVLAEGLPLPKLFRDYFGQVQAGPGYI